MELATTHSALFHEIAVLPIVETVLFPGIVLPLKVVEKRYTTLVADVLAGQHHVALALQQPQADEACGEPALFPVCCAAKIIHAKRVDEGHYHVLLQGMHRLRLLDEWPQHRAYRCFRAEIIPPPPPAACAAAGREFGQLHSCVLHLASLVADSDPQLVEVLGATADPLQLIDILCAVFVPDPLEQQRYLGMTDLKERLENLLGVLAEVMLKVSKGGWSGPRH